MKTTTTLILLIAIVLPFSGCIKNTPQSVLLQGHRMAGKHTWYGVENDHLLPSYPDYRPVHDTSFVVKFKMSIYFETDTSFAIYADTVYQPSTYYLSKFHFISHDETQKTLTYCYANSCCAMIRNDTITLNYENNTIRASLYFQPYKGTYIINMHTP